MKDRKKETEKVTELRVVEDTEPTEPVARLHAPEKVKGFTPRNVGLEVPESPLAELDEEREVDFEPAKPLVIPPAFLIGGALLFVAMLGYGGWLLLTSKKNPDDLSLVVQANIAEKKREEIAVEDLVANVRKTIAGFTSATTVEEMARWVRQPERVKPLMEKYYLQHEILPREGARLRQQIPVALSDTTFEVRTFVVLQCDFEDGSEDKLLAEYTPEGEVLIDWESIVCYQPAPIDEILNARSTEPVDLRVYAKPDNFYLHEFKDSRKYQCVRLSFRDSELQLYGYVERESAAAQELKKHLMQSMSPFGEPCLLRVRFLEGSDPSTGVLIEDFLASRWAYINNPADERK